MNTINYEIDITAPIGKVYEYYTNPDNIKKAWPQDIVKESESVSGVKGEEASEIKVEGEYMRREQEMILQVTDKEESKRLVTESTQEFNEDQGNTHVRHSIEYELPHQEKLPVLYQGNKPILNSRKVYNRPHKQ